jgi:hypothetical protein
MSPERQRSVQITSKNTKVTVESITTARSDESTAKKTCSAVLTAVMPQDAIPTDQRMLNHLRGTYEPQGAALEGNTVKGNVTYTVQRTEDSKEMLVKLNGHLAFMGLFHDLAMLRVFDKSEAEIAKIAGEAPPAAVAKSAEPPPRGLASHPACASCSCASACEYGTRCRASHSASQRDGCSSGCDRAAPMHGC